MKKLFFVSFCITAIALIYSCNNNKKETSGTKENTEKPATKPAGDFTGTYTTTENDMPMQFVLKADGKGHENYHSEIRPFSWIKKDGKIFIKYDGETAEFELPLDLEKGEIHYGSLVYKKE